MPVTVNCCAVPAAILGFAGITVSETSMAGVTLSDVEPDTPARAAPIVAEPWPRPVAKPFEPAALLTDATPGLLELHTTAVVRFCVELSV